MKYIKKLSILLLSILILTACNPKETEASRLVCQSDRNPIYEEDMYPQNFEKKWMQQTTNYAIDNYIVRFENRVEFFMTPSAQAYLADELSGNKEALLNEFMASYMFNDFQSVDKEMIDGIEYLEDRIIVRISGENPQRPKGWRGLVLPDQYKLSNLFNKLTYYEDQCEIIKD